MKRSEFSEEQIAYALRQVESGTPVTAIYSAPSAEAALELRKKYGVIRTPPTGSRAAGPWLTLRR